jgi:hypothetical protein
MKKSLLILNLFAFNITLFAADSITAEVSAVVFLRQEVETLSTEVESLKKSGQSEMDVYIQREQEISAMLLKERFKTDQLKVQIEVGKNKIETSTKKVPALSGEKWIAEFWNRYQSSLKSAQPVYATKLSDRLQKIKLDFIQKRISYEHALLQTWYLLDEDLKKSQEAEFILAPLRIKEKTYHVEMVRMGRAGGYLRTANGEYGQLQYNKDWEIVFFDDSQSKKMIETLLVQFKQQQKTGLYSLPGKNL